MPGHLFIVQGDLTRLACDAWLLPTSRTLWIEEHWLRRLPAAIRELGRLESLTDPISGDRRPVRVYDHAGTTPHGWHTERVRSCTPVAWKIAENAPRPWLTQMARDDTAPPEEKATWYAEGARQFVVHAAGALGGKSRLPERPRPLLALPVVGTGHGGGSHEAGIVLQALLRVLSDAVGQIDADVALVAYSRDQLAAAQHERRKLMSSGRHGSDWSVLPDRLRATARSLAELSANGQLVLFLGAGVSVGAGLPTWQGLLDGLAEEAGLDPQAQKALKGLSVLDQAHVLQVRLAATRGDDGQPRSFRDAIAQRTSVERYGLAHALLPNLNVTESVTTNYDTLFEDASRSAGYPTAVLPYESSQGGGRWLLKLHGCVSKPEDIVLTREDFLRYDDQRGALAGIVQAMLITRHMLFVGFSLADENFLRIVDEVRKAVRLPKPSGEASDPLPFGTALLLDRSPLLAEIWQHDIACVPISESEPPGAESDDDVRRAHRAAAANSLEVLLDYVLFEANRNVSHLLDERYDGLLNEDERRLRDLVNILGDAPSEVRRLPAWGPIAGMLRALGDRGERNH